VYQLYGSIITLQIRRNFSEVYTIRGLHKINYSAVIAAVDGVAKWLIIIDDGTNNNNDKILLFSFLRQPASCNAAIKPHHVHIYRHYVAITIMQRVAVIIHMRRSIAYAREDTQRPDFFPKTNPCLAMAPKP
jgi:hypothetical protein